jgi:hypothetical protein
LYEEKWELFKSNKDAFEGNTKVFDAKINKKWEIYKDLNLRQD